MSIFVVFISDQAGAQEAARGIAARLSEKVKSTAGIDLRTCKELGDAEFTVQELRRTVEYRLEHLSYDSEPPAPTV